MSFREILVLAIARQASRVQVLSAEITGTTNHRRVAELLTAQKIEVSHLKVLENLLIQFDSHFPPQ